MDTVLFEIKDISFNEFYNLVDKSEYTFVFDNAVQLKEQKNIFSVPEMHDCKFGHVKDLQAALDAGISWEQLIVQLAILTGRKECEFVKESIFSLWKQKNWIVSEMEKVNKTEGLMLTVNVPGGSDLESETGFDVFGAYAQYRQFGITFGILPDAVYDLKYSAVFTELAYQTKMFNFTQNKRK